MKVLSGNAYEVRERLKELGCKWDGEYWTAPESAWAKCQAIVDEDNRARAWGVFVEYLGSLVWADGSFTQTVWAAALRAGSLGVEYRSAWAEIAGRVRVHKRVDDAWFDRNVLRGYEQAAADARESGVRIQGSGNAGSAPGNPSTGSGSSRSDEKPVFRNDVLSRVASSVVVADLGWLADRSPVDPSGVTAGDFLSALYEPGERVVVFDVFESQGQWLWEASAGIVEAAVVAGLYNPKEKPVVRSQGSGVSKFTGRGPKGIWYLCNPVDGEFHWMTESGSDPHWSRRFHECVTSFRYMVIESDVADAREWVKAVVQWPLRIAAIYTSGGSDATRPAKQSVHVLIRLDAGSKDEWDECKAGLKDPLIALGADKGCMSAVRLTRLPGCFRLHDKKGVPFKTPRAQKLLWLNPNPGMTPIESLPPVRDALGPWLRMGEGILNTDLAEVDWEMVARCKQRLAFFASDDRARKMERALPSGPSRL